MLIEFDKFFVRNEIKMYLIMLNSVEIIYLFQMERNLIECRTVKINNKVVI